MGSTEGRRASVLVVDDDPKAVKIVSSYLADEAVDVDSAYRGLEALASKETVLLDVVTDPEAYPPITFFEGTLEKVRAARERV